jgi:heme/copper-type cytochrome/quinol oxidase subunit 2
VGIFDVMCSQYCGLEHAHMLTKIMVLPEEGFTNGMRARRENLVPSKHKIENTRLSKPLPEKIV